MAQRDWRAWHDAYDDPGSSLAQRLAVVQDQVTRALDAAPPGPLRAVSLCAGQGRDLLPVLAAHPRGHEVQARLVELDPRNTGLARQAAELAGLDKVEVVTTDAGITGAYRDLVPAYLVLACGVFGNITDADIKRTIACCTALCAPGGTVVWTRARGVPDKVPQICRWFDDQGFELQWLSDPQLRFGVGAHRFGGESRPLPAGQRMFTFVGFDTLHGGRLADQQPG